MNKNNLALAVTALAVGFWLWLAYHQLKTAFALLNPVPLLLGLESIVTGYFLLARREEAPNNPHPWYIRYLIIPLVFIGPLLIKITGPMNLAVTAVSSIGLALTIWALVSLGKSFGIAPADRGLITFGPYRFLRHPMYTGAMLNLAAVVVGSLTLWNVFVFLLVVILNFCRIILEERTVSGYEQYAQQVRWRVIPGLW